MLRIQGPQTVSGEIQISGSKNAALPLIAASLYFEESTLTNVPRIGDVFTFLAIIESLGVTVQFEGNTLKMNTKNMSLDNLDRILIKKIRVGIFLIPVLLERFGNIEIPYPGGCNIGKRPIDDHIRGFQAMGYTYEWEDDIVKFSGTPLNTAIELSAGFAVTATENMIIANAFRPGKTTIKLAAIEPHVLNLIEYLKNAGASIQIDHNHTITIEWTNIKPKNNNWTVIHDYIESWTFIILAAIASKDFLDIKNARQQDLFAFLSKCREAWVRFEDIWDDTLRVYNSRESLKPVHIQTNIFPGFPTDLQSPFSILMTQAEGVSRIHEVLFEWRLNWLVEIEKMKWHIAIMNPHEALVFWKTHLRWATVSSWDLRAGVAMILAGMITDGVTDITNVEYIERGYENIIGKLASIWATIETV